jgi:hypothetical protein
MSTKIRNLWSACFDFVEFWLPVYLSGNLSSLQQSHRTIRTATANKAIALNETIRKAEPNIPIRALSGAMSPPRFILKGDGPS